MQVTLHINGTPRRLDLPDGTTLLEALRDHANLTGTKYGCGEGQCGACTVLVDGKAVQSCTLLAADVTAKRITTIEGLQHPLVQSFLDHAAFQCGYCTPGMLLAAAALLSANPRPSKQQIREALDGHICRCGAHPRIVAAIQAVRR